MPKMSCSTIIRTPYYRSQRLDAMRGTLYDSPTQSGQWTMDNGQFNDGPILGKLFPVVFCVLI